MFFLYIARALSFSIDKPYSPDIKIGIINRKYEKCTQIVKDTSIVFCNVVARVEGQPYPIVNTTATGNPLRINMGSKRVIPGFLKGINSACLGDTRRITIPSGLAYGDQYVDGVFDPDSTWIVDVEILEIVNNDKV